MQFFEEDSEPRHLWLRFWKQNKQRTGVKCKSLEASGRMAFRLKCLSNEVPVLTILRKRKPEIYSTSTCVACQEEDETLDHLTVCKMYDWYWEMIEEVASEGAWKKLDDSSKVLLPKPEFEKIIFGPTSEIRRSWRKSHIRGLLVNDMIDELYKAKISKKEVFRCLDFYSRIVEECFYEEIWQRRCKEVNQWEKVNGISRNDKCKKCDKGFSSRKVTLSNRILGEESLLNNGVKDDYRQRRKDLVESLFSQGVEDRIVNGVVPFWFGL